jgi:hypothetical protein
MNFSNFKLAETKGTVRKSTKGATRESNFAFRFAHYTKDTKSGSQEVNQFAFTEGALAKFGLSSQEVGAVPFVDDAENPTFAGIAVVPAANAIFLGTAKRGEDKARNVSVPVLVKYLEQVGMLDITFEGSQYFDLESIGENEGVSYLKIIPSSVQPKVYNPRESKSEVSTDELTAMSDSAE